MNPIAERAWRSRKWGEVTAAARNVGGREEATARRGQVSGFMLQILHIKDKCSGLGSPIHDSIRFTQLSNLIDSYK